MYVCKYTNYNTMNEHSKNHTTSKLVAKVLLRLFIIILGLAAFPFLSGKSQQLDKSYVYFEHKWFLVFPFLLFTIFVILLITMLKEKYKKTDINWLFSLSALMLIGYLIMLYTRIYPMFNM